MKTFIALSIAGSIAAAGLAATTSVASAATTSAHAAWCEQNYRSYNATTDSFIGNDGYAHRCVAPGDTATFGAVSPFSFAPNNSTGALRSSNPNGPGSGTAYRVFPGDDENGTPENPPANNN